MTKILKLVALVLLACVGTSSCFRAANIEIWEIDGRSYAISGSRSIYYLFGPLTYIDGAVTKIGLHVWPHQH